MFANPHICCCAISRKGKASKAGPDSCRSGNRRMWHGGESKEALCDSAAIHTVVHETECLMDDPILPGPRNGETGKRSRESALWGIIIWSTTRR